MVVKSAQSSPARGGQGRLESAVSGSAPAQRSVLTRVRRETGKE